MIDSNFSITQSIEEAFPIVDSYEQPSKGHQLDGNCVYEYSSQGHTWTKLEVELDEASPATWLIEASISSKAFQCIPCLSSKSPVFTLQGIDYITDI